jgi:hypothetical protein
VLDRQLNFLDLALNDAKEQKHGQVREVRSGQGKYFRYRRNLRDDILQTVILDVLSGFVGET